MAGCAGPKKDLARVTDPAVLRVHIERSAKLLFHPPRGTRFADISLAELQIPAIEITPPSGAASPLILYFHGGGYLFGSPRTHRGLVAHLAARTGMRAVLPHYRLGPEHPFPAASDDALCAYQCVQDHPGGVILGGDSAGGGLALALLAQIGTLGLRQPIGTFAFSPLTDLTFSGGTFITNAEADPLLPAHRAAEMAQMYMQGSDVTDPRASPLFADFAGAGPVWLAASTTEILLDDTRRIADRMITQGIDVTCVIERDLPHVWPLMHGLIPEAGQTLAELTGWITSLSRL